MFCPLIHEDLSEVRKSIRLATSQGLPSPIGEDVILSWRCKVVCVEILPSWIEFTRVLGESSSHKLFAKESKLAFEAAYNAVPL